MKSPTILMWVRILHHKVPACVTKERARSLLVALELRPQRLGRVESHGSPNATVKVKANSCTVDLPIEVEQVRLHHSLLEPEGGATSDMSHAGEPVGVMGTGADSPTILYVEIRHNRQPIDPIPWLMAGDRKVSG